MELNLLIFEPESQNFFCIGIENESLFVVLGKQGVHCYGKE